MNSQATCQTAQSKPFGWLTPSACSNLCGPKARAETLVAATGKLFSHGIVSEPSDAHKLQSLVSKRFDGDTPEARAQADISLSAAWLRKVAANSGGLGDEGQVNMLEDVPTKRSLFTDMLIEAGSGASEGAYDALAPQHSQYKALKESLHEYRVLRAQGGWLAIPDGETIESGDYDPRVPALRTRLAIEGFLSTDESDPAPAVVTGLEGRQVKQTATPSSVENAADSEPDPTLYGEDLVAALERFQTAHGIKVDGLVGPATLEALNESVDSKIDRIADTMHRWRAHGDLGRKYIWANTPSFTAEGWEGGERKIAMKTIVGMRSRETPVFSDEIEYAVANPRWYVPVSILRRDKLPKLQNDPGYANRSNFTVYNRETGNVVSASDVNWSDPSSASRYRLVQGPGEENALGALKLIFPNQYSVYLHGTPSEHLFDRAQRALSSGCIRMEEPVRMARWVAPEEETTRSIQEATNGDALERIPFQEHVPVHVTYMTVTVNPDGQPVFWRDVYEKDDGIEMVRRLAPLYTEANSAPETADNGEG